MKNLITILCLCLSLNLVLGSIDDIEVKLWGECYNIKETTSLNLSNSELTGEIPLDVCELTSLIIIDLSWSELIGEIPDCIGDLLNLSQLLLMLNDLEGSVPNNLWNLRNLTYLDLGYN